MNQPQIIMRNFERVGGLVCYTLTLSGQSICSSLSSHAPFSWHS